MAFYIFVLSPCGYFKKTNEKIGQPTERSLHRCRCHGSVIMENSTLVKLLATPINGLRRHLTRNRSCEDFTELVNELNSDRADIDLSMPSDILDPTRTDTTSGNLDLSPRHLATAIPNGQQKGKKRGKDKGTPISQPALCVKNCKHKSKQHSFDMVQCHLCQTWCHYDCMGVDPNDIIGLWCCLNCRQLHSLVRTLCDDMVELKVLQENNS